MIDPVEIKTIEQLEKEVEEFLLLGDKNVVKTIIATIIANKMQLSPVWLLLVAPSSGGKSELIGALSGLPFIHAISDLTVNTFVSGLKRPGKETSLLFKITGGIMTFKDFTSILSKNKDARKEIMGQLREVYDGDYTKRTGTGDDIHWHGRVGAIGASTEAIYKAIGEMTQMGDRFIMYTIEQAERIDSTIRAMENAPFLVEKRNHLQNCFTSYIQYLLNHLEISGKDIEISSEIKMEILQVADFAARARSAVDIDIRTGLVDFVPSIEMPMRMITQLYNLAKAFTVMRASVPESNNLVANTLTDDDKKILLKIAFDSIPKTRRMVLYYLAKYIKGISTAGVAVAVNLPTESIKKYLFEVNALGICERKKRKGAQGDQWIIIDSYRQVIRKVQDIVIDDGELIAQNIDLDAELDQVMREQANEKMVLESLNSDLGSKLDL